MDRIITGNVFHALKEFYEIYEGGPCSKEGNVPLFYCPSSTSDRFPQFSHIMKARGGSINSPLYTYFEKIIFNFLRHHHLPTGEVIRACLNMQYHLASEYPHTDPHIDSWHDHNVVIIYLTEAEGDTIVYEKQRSHMLAKDNNKTLIPVDKIPDDFPIYELIPPEKGKIAVFNGKHYHANYFPKPGQLRLICIFNVSKTESPRKS